MAKKRAVQFLVDDKGRRKSVLMSYRTYLRLVEDAADLQAIEEREGQPVRDLEDIIAELENAGRI